MWFATNQKGNKEEDIPVKIKSYPIRILQQKRNITWTDW